MNLSNAMQLGREILTPCTGDLPRKSLESVCAGASSRSSRGSTDVKASRTELACASIASRAQRKGIVLEVGRSVDLDEERKRLERNWISEDALLIPSQKHAAHDTSLQYSAKNAAQQRAVGVDVSRTDTLTGQQTQQQWREQGRSLAYSDTNKDRPSPSRIQSLIRRSRRAGFRRSSKQSQKTAAESQDHSSLGRPYCQEQADSIYLSQWNQKLEKARLSQGAWHSDKGIGGLDSSTDMGLLSRETEAELGRIVQLGLSTAFTLSEHRERESADALSKDQQEQILGIPADIVELRLANQKAARNLLIQYNLRLLAKVACMYEGRGMDLDDLIVEGMNGLERAIDRFDPEKGFKFSTYAYPWIRQVIGRCIEEHCRVVRLPAHVHEIVGRMRRVQSQLAEESDQPVTSTQIARRMGLPVYKVELYQRASQDPRSLDDSLTSSSMRADQEGDQVLADVLEDDTPTADELLVQDAKSSLMRQDVDAVLNGLSLRERNVLRYRYGLYTEELSLQELSAVYGISKERVRQIGDIALAKLQMRQANNGKALSKGRRCVLPTLNPKQYCFG